MISINVAGDFYINSEFINTLSINSEVKNVFKKAALNIVNFEAPIVEKATPKDKYGPSLFMDKSCVKFLKELNVDLVTLANNHIMDQGEQGLDMTMQNLNENTIEYIGADVNLEKASLPFKKKFGDINLGIINFAENEFSNTNGNYHGAAPLDLIENTLAIQKLKKEVDKVIVIVHGGAEMHKYPSPRFKKTLRYFALQGADAVIAHHTHRYNGYEVFNEVPIVYGVGNFIFPRKGSNDLWNIGVVANLTIEKKGVTLKTIPVKLNYENGLELSLLSNIEASDFLNSEKDKSEVIANDELLEKKYDEFIVSVYNQYVHYLQPYTSKYLHKLFSMGIIPNFLKNNKKRLLYLNLVRCEAHRDVLLKILNYKK